MYWLEVLQIKGVNLVDVNQLITIMKKPILFFATFLMLYSLSNAQTDPDWDWETKLESYCSSSNGEVVVQDISVSFGYPPPGQVKSFTYVTGRFRGTITLNGHSITSFASGGGFCAPQYSCFLAQFDDAGNLRWVTKFGDYSSYQTGMSLATDVYGSVYVAGQVKTEYVSVGSYKVEVGENLLTATGYSTSLPAAKTVATTRKQHIPFLAKFNVNGGITWLSIVEAENGIATSVALAPAPHDGSGSLDGEVYITGYFYNDLSYPLGNANCRVPSPTNNLKTFVAKYKTNTGNIVWANYINSTDPDAGNLGHGVSVEGDYFSNNEGRTSNQDVYIVGEYAGQAEIEHSVGLPHPLPAPQGIDGYIAKLDHTNGEFIWEEVMSSPGTDRAREIDLFAINAEIYVIGDYAGGSAPLMVTGASGNIMKSSGGSEDIFICRYDWNANLQWLTLLESASESHGTDIIALNENTVDELHIAGTYASDMTDEWGQTLPKHSAGSDADHFIAKLDRSNGFTIWADGVDGSTQATPLDAPRPRIDYRSAYYNDIYMSGSFVAGETPTFTSQISTTQGMAAYVAKRVNDNCPPPLNVAVDRSNPAAAIVTWDENDFASSVTNYVISYKSLPSGSSMGNGPYAAGAGSYTSTPIATPDPMYQWEVVSQCSYGFQNSDPVFMKNGEVREAASATIITEGFAKSEEVKVYPNPTNGNLFIDGKFTKATDGIQSVEVSDLLGRVVLVETIDGASAKNYQLSMAGLETGVYIVTVKSTGNTYSFKISKE